VQFAALLGTLALPVSIGFGILKLRLYDVELRAVRADLLGVVQDVLEPAHIALSMIIDRGDITP